MIYLRGTCLRLALPERWEMYAGNAAATALRKPGPDRRSSSRDTLVLRVGVIRDASRTSFCLVKNISADGLQVKIFGRVAVGADIMMY